MHCAYDLICTLNTPIFLCLGESPAWFDHPTRARHFKRITWICSLWMAPAADWPLPIFTLWEMWRDRSQLFARAKLETMTVADAVATVAVFVVTIDLTAQCVSVVVESASGKLRLEYWLRYMQCPVYLSEHSPKTVKEWISSWLDTQNA